MTCTHCNAPIPELRGTQKFPAAGVVRIGVPVRYCQPRCRETAKKRRSRARQRAA